MPPPLLPTYSGGYPSGGRRKKGRGGFAIKLVIFVVVVLCGAYAMFGPHFWAASKASPRQADLRPSDLEAQAIKASTAA